MYISVAQKLPEIWLETSKQIFLQKPDFVKIDEFSLLKRKKYKNRKIDTFTFLAISLAIFELQRRTIPHFNPLNNSFWPYEGPFCCRANSFWAIWPNVRPIFFNHTLIRRIKEKVPNLNMEPIIKMFENLKEKIRKADEFGLRSLN